MYFELKRRILILDCCAATLTCGGWMRDTRCWMLALLDETTPKFQTIASDLAQEEAETQEFINCRGARSQSCAG